jgi:hypothetical protein
MIGNKTGINTNTVFRSLLVMKYHAGQLFHNVKKNLEKVELNM